MKIGDKVKFLNEIGGGIIAGFQGKNIVLVEDEDGFQIPISINEVVLDQANNYNTSRVAKTNINKFGSKPNNAFENPESRSVKALLREGQDEDVDMSVADVIDDTKEVTFRAKPRERKGGNQLFAYLAFVPVSAGGDDASRYEMYFVNDSNYYMRFACSKRTDNRWELQYDGEAEPNAKQFLGKFTREEAAGLGKLAVQMMAYKRDGAFDLKPSADVLLRIDPQRFYKVHTFKTNPFFETASILFTIVENDKVDRPRDIDAEKLKRSMFKAAEEEKTAPQSLSKNQREQLVRRYADDQRKGGRRKAPYMHHKDSDDTVVVDLHAGQILDTTMGMEAGDILEYQLQVFRDTLEKLSGKKGQRVVFIHGKGEGVLRRAIISELTYRYKPYTYQDASFQEYGYGATMVTIK
ncbi:DUF2027 domain-containing protein [Hallella bergensis]|uniref:DUF2027 domain-containing protein n=1 Tax=Hallella bergensis TaxID=242750 RepID=UPI0023F2FDFC|nr:DUF2027 domain-containing protein [Hallella bergensis]